MREPRAIYHHNGYRLRSYTELMWARLMEAAEIFYLYEPDLIRVDDGYYLPDFWLPHVGIYLEVKGKEPTVDEIKKADAVMARTGREVVFLIGRPGSDDGGLFNCGFLARGAAGWTHNISPNDLHRLVLKLVSRTMWFRIILSVKEDDMDYVRRAGDILEEMFLVRADRSDMERVLREIHAEANAARLAAAPPSSVCETGLKAFFDRQEFRISQRGAA